MAGVDLVVTNFNANFTGVSATAAAVARAQQSKYDMRLAGYPLPGCAEPVSRTASLVLARNGPATRPFQIWHVRRNPEMQMAMFVRDILRFPIRIVFTSAAQRRHSAWPRFLISRMDAIIATTDKAASYVDNVWSVVTHGVDTLVFHPAKSRADSWVATGYPGKRGIACIGRIRPEKGTDRFVDTAIEVLANTVDVTALIIGRAKPEHQSFLKELKARVARAGMQKRILFIGEVPPGELPMLVRSLSLLVALPRYEGYGMTPLEAMASGVPIIASDTGHFREFVGQGEAGYVLASTDGNSVSRVAIDILGNQKRYDTLAAQCVTRAAKNYSIDKEVSRISWVYERLWDTNRFDG